MQGYLYLLPNAERTAFKIGVTVDPNKRVHQIGAPLDTENALFYEAKDPYRIEARLHRVFDDHRIIMDYRDGNSEWFSIECIKLVRTFLENFSEELGITGCQALGYFLKDRPAKSRYAAQWSLPPSKQIRPLWKGSHRVRKKLKDGCEVTYVYAYRGGPQVLKIAGGDAEEHYRLAELACAEGLVPEPLRYEHSRDLE